MSFASLEPQCLLDLRTNIKQNAHFITSTKILYSAGAVLLLHDFQQQTQRYLQLMEKSTSLEMMVLSPTRKLVAIIINDEKGHIVIYEVNSLKKKRTLYLPHDAQTKRFEHICFSYDEKLVIAVTGEPDWMMLSYNWERGKVETFTRANYQNNPGPVAQVHCSPMDSAVCCLIGPALFRLMNMQETVWRQYGFQKAEQVNITTAAFLGGDRIIAGTACGKLLLVDLGELRAVYDAATVQQIRIADREEGGSNQPVAIPKPTALRQREDRQVRSLIAFSKGFAYSCKVGQVHMFETDEKDTYNKRNLFVISDPDFREVQTPPLNIVNHLSIDPEQDQLLATTNRSQLYTVRLWGPSIIKQPEIPFIHLGEAIHHGPITGLAMCAWKPIFMTCGAIDRTVRIWNYETSSVEMIKQYEEDVLSVSLHPTGLFAAIGFNDQLRYMMVLLDDIIPHRVFPVALCHLSSFSWFGHFLAVVNKITILVYSTVSFREVRRFRGHGGKITALVWTPDDQKLISCGEDGAVYEWDMVHGLRVNETVEKGVSYRQCAVTGDGKYVYAVGNDGLLKEITESNILRSFRLGQTNLPYIIMSRSEQMMFVCGNDGSLMSLKLPLAEPVDKKSFLFHHSKISKIALSYDDQTAITVSETGTLCIWNVRDAEGKTIAVEPGFTFCLGVLIPKMDLQDKVDKIKELNQRLQELVMEQDYRIKQAEANHNAMLQEMNDTFNEEINELKRAMSKTEQGNARKINNLLTEMKALKEVHEVKRQETEALYDSRLLIEYEKLTTALAERETMAADYENKITEIIKNNDIALKDMENNYVNQINKLNADIEQLTKQLAENKADHEEIKKQIEDDADREIVELKAAYEKTLREERELNVQFRAEAGVMRKKVDLSVKESDKFKIHINQLLTEQKKFEKEIANLNDEITELKKEIYERDLTIQDKEKRIYDMKKKNEELEKFKFVLTHKIEEIKNQLEPKERELDEKDKQIVEMESEMELMQIANSNLDVTIAELKEKATATEIELRKTKDKCEGLSNNMKRMGLDILSVVDQIQDVKKLKTGVLQLHAKYASSSDIASASVSQTDLEAELMRQREHLERTVYKMGLAIKRLKDKPSDGAKCMKENMILLEEINELHNEMKVKDDKIAEYERFVLNSAGSLVSGKELYKRLEVTFKSHEEAQQTLKEQIEQAQNVIKLQEKELDRLRKQKK